MLRFLFLWFTCLICLSVPCLAQEYSESPLTLTNDEARVYCEHYQRIKSINVSGNRQTRTEVILRELSVRQGEPVCSDSMDQILLLNYRRLYNLNMFTSIELRAIPYSEDSTYTIIDIDLKEQWFLIPQADLQLADRNINVWWDEQNHALSRINLGLYLQHKNVSGNLDNLSTSLHIGYTQQLTLSYFRPYIDRAQKQGIGFGIGTSRSREVAYTSDSNKLRFVRDDHNFITSQFFANITYTYRPAYHSRHVLQAAYYAYKTEDTVQRLNADYFADNSLRLRYFELAYRYELNRVDNWNYPRRGLKVVTGATARAGIEGMNFQALAFLELGLFRKLADRCYASFIFRGRTSTPQSQPYFLQSALGYKTNYIRGYEYYVIDAYHFGIARLNLKYEMVRSHFRGLPFRYLPEVPLWIYPKIFFDAGYAANPDNNRNNYLANRALFSYGIGVDIITAYDLKLRIEFAVNHLKESGLFLHANSE